MDTQNNAQQTHPEGLSKSSRFLHPQKIAPLLKASDEGVMQSISNQHGIKTMELEIDKIISSLVKDLAKSVADKTFDIGTKQYKKALVLLEMCFTKYLNRSFDRYSKIKTLLYRDRPVDLKAHYVAANFKLGDNEEVCGSDIISSFIDNKRSVVLGTAGSGKSVLLRRIFIDLVENTRGLTPILIELRFLITPVQTYSIFEFIYKTIQESDEGFTEEQLHYALKEGKIFLFLDGFDEIDFEKKDDYEREIFELSNKYSESTIVISSRPDDCFSSWDEYFIYYTLPLNKTQSIDLIERIDYDNTVKNKFVGELKEGLYEKHTDFLSNPLLLTMMLLTYEQLAEIPEKIHIFYEQAFDTLYHKHDALKSLYKRKSYSGLPVDDFKKIFSAFCIITYSERKMSFSYVEIISYLEKSIKIEGFDLEAGDFINDLIKSVCIIQKDGNIYTFSHRSFQEYFAAFFISKSQTIDVASVLDKISMSHFSDNIIPILFELNREQIETQWVIPRLKEILEKTNRPISNKDVINFLSVFYDSFSFHPKGVSFSFSNKRRVFGHFTLWSHRLYRDETKLFFPIHKDEDDGARTLQRERDLKIFKENLNIDDLNKDFLLADMPEDIDWLSKTDIPISLRRRFDYLTHLHEKLTKKYSERKNNLISLFLT